MSNNIDANTARLAGLQIDQLTKLRVGQITLDQIERFNNLSPEDREERFGDWKRPTSISVAAKVYLKRLFEGETITIGATNGAVTLQESGVFPGGVFNENLLSGGCKSAPAINVVVDELVLNGKFSDFLGNIATELEKRRLHRGHLVNFCEKHPKKLREGGYATFAVVTKNDEPVKDDLSNVFIASVFFDDAGRLRVRVYPFSEDYVWCAEDGRRVVSPQQ